MLARALPLPAGRIGAPPAPAASRAAIVVDVRCPRCNATVWFDDDEWKCSMCARPVWPATPKSIEIKPVPAAASSSLHDFLTERCETTGDGQVDASELYANYLEWSVEHGKEALSRGAFARALHTEGFQRFRTRFARYWRGLRCAS